MKLMHCAFRARLSAAPLKLQDVTLEDFSPEIFPRSIERGPVEAASFWRKSDMDGHLSALD